MRDVPCNHVNIQQHTDISPSLCHSEAEEMPPSCLIHPAQVGRPMDGSPLTTNPPIMQCHDGIYTNSSFPQEVTILRTFQLLY